MRRLGWLVAIAVGLGLWAGLRVGNPDGEAFRLTIVLLAAASLLTTAAVWLRVPLGSFQRAALRLNGEVSVAMLVGELPRLFWPAATAVHLWAGLVSLGLLGFVVYRSRQLRANRLTASVTPGEA